ncbi:MAG: hypothetical protein AAF808_19645 [Cyanobacteria bacterium P01_D01_bin.2]
MPVTDALVDGHQIISERHIPNGNLTFFCSEILNIAKAQAGQPVPNAYASMSKEINC